MPEILTTNFKTDNARRFVDDVLSNDYYVFISGTTQDDAENSIRSKMEFLEKTIFGKKVYDSDVKFMVKYYPWQRETVYSKFDDITDLEGVNFYSVVGPTNHNTGDYRVYKCLDNGDGSPSINAPQWDADTPDQLYDTQDGYIWKFMYSMTRIEFDAYNALGYIPIIGTFDTDPTSTTGGSPFSDIVIENSESSNGYKTVTGNLDSVPSDNPTSNISSFYAKFTSETFGSSVGYYVGQTILLTNPVDNFTDIFTILVYTYDENTNRARFIVQNKTKPNSQYSGYTGFGSNAKFKVLPRIIISGDGTGAIGYPIIDNGSITDIVLHNPGEGYNNAVAEVRDPIYDFDPDNPNTVDVRAIIRPVLAPVDGHGTNLLDELKCRHVLLYGYITGADNTQIGYNNTYSKVGIVRNPTFDIYDPTTETTTFTVTVATGTNDYGAGNKYYINGSVSPQLTLVEGQTYVFDQSDASNATHPLRFSETGDGTHGGGVEYTTGVTTNGTPGSAGAYTQIVVEDPAPILHYYCTAHSGMGGQANTDQYAPPANPNIFDNRFGFVTDEIAGVQKNEILYQIDGSNVTVFQGKVFDLDYTSNTVWLVEYSGSSENQANSDISFDDSLTFRRSNGQIIRINTPVANNIIESTYVQRSGKVYYMEDFFPLERTENSREEFKFVMEF